MLALSEPIGFRNAVTDEQPPSPTELMQRIRALNCPQKLDADGNQQIAFHDMLRSCGKYLLTGDGRGEVRLPKAAVAIKQSLDEMESEAADALYAKVSVTATPLQPSPSPSP